MVVSRKGKLAEHGRYHIFAVISSLPFGAQGRDGGGK